MVCMAESVKVVVQRYVTVCMAERVKLLVNDKQCAVNS